MAVNPLFALLQSAGIVPATAPSTPQSVGLRDIIVNAAQKPAEEEVIDQGPMPLGNRSYVEEAAQAEENTPQRKGSFGLKGTLRDILGTLSDAFLVQSGNKAVYAPYRQQEREADALAGFTQNPQAAAERLARYNPKLAADLYDQILQRQTQAGTAAGVSAKNKGEAFKEGSRLFGQYSGAIARNPRLAPQLLPILQAVKEQYGLGDEFTIPGTEEKDLAEALQYGGTPTQVQIADSRKEQDLALREELERMKEAGRQDRFQPRAAPQPKQRGATNVDAEILDAVRKGTATPNEMKIYKERLTRATGSKTAPPPPRKAGDKIIGPNGTVLTSTDGKTWDK